MPDGNAGTRAAKSSHLALQCTIASVVHPFSGFFVFFLFVSFGFVLYKHSSCRVLHLTRLCETQSLEVTHGMGSGHKTCAEIQATLWHNAFWWKHYYFFCLLLLFQFQTQKHRSHWVFPDSEWDLITSHHLHMTPAQGKRTTVLRNVKSCMRELKHPASWCLASRRSHQISLIGYCYSTTTTNDL